MRIQILSDSGHYLLGFAKNKLKALSALRKDLDLPILNKVLYVKEHQIFIESSYSGNLIRISGEAFRGAIIFAEGVMQGAGWPYYDPYSLVVAEAYNTATDSPGKAKRVSFEPVQHPIGHMYRYGLLSALEDNKQRFYLFEFVQGFYEKVRTVGRDLALGPRVDTNMPARPDIFDPEGLPWAIDNPSAFPFNNITAHEKNNFSVASWSVPEIVGTGEDRRVYMYAILSTASHITGPYTVLQTFTAALMQSFGGELPGEPSSPPDQLLIADLGALASTGRTQLIAAESGEYLYAAVHHRADYYYALRNYRYLVDFYKVHLGTGAVEIYGTYSLNDITATLWNRLAMVTNQSSNEDYFGYCVLSSHDYLYLFWSDEGRPDLAMGVVVDLEPLIGTRRPVENTILATTIGFYMGDFTYFLAYLSPSSLTTNGLARLVIHYDEEHPELTTTTLTPLYTAPEGHMLVRIGTVTQDNQALTFVTQELLTGKQTLRTYLFEKEREHKIIDINNRFINGFVF